MKTQILGGLFAACVIILTGHAAYSQDVQWSVALSADNSDFLEIVLSSEVRVAMASCWVSLYDSNGNQVDSDFSFKERDGTNLEPGVYRRFIPHKVPNVRSVRGIYLMCLPPMPPGARPAPARIPPTDDDGLWDEEDGITLN